MDFTFGITYSSFQIILNTELFSLKTTWRQLITSTIASENLFLQFLLHSNTSSSPGPDNIPSMALKLSGIDLLLLVTKLFNLSLQQGCFPNYLKTSLMIMVTFDSKIMPPQYVSCLKLFLVFL